MRGMGSQLSHRESGNAEDRTTSRRARPLQRRMARVTCLHPPWSAGPCLRLAGVRLAVGCTAVCKFSISARRGGTKKNKSNSDQHRTACDGLHIPCRCIAPFVFGLVSSFSSAAHRIDPCQSLFRAIADQPGNSMIDVIRSQQCIHHCGCKLN